MTYLFEGAKLHPMQVEELIIDALSGKEPDKVIKLLAEGLFPHKDLEYAVAIQKLENELNDFFDRLENVSVDDSFDDSFNNQHLYRISLSFSTLDAMNIYKNKIQLFFQYLANKYGVEISTSWTLYFYEEPCKQDKLHADMEDESPTQIEDKLHVETKANDLTCMHCKTTDIEQVIHRGTYIYICNQCPNVTVEYSYQENIDALNEYLNLKK